MATPLLSHTLHPFSPEKPLSHTSTTATATTSTAATTTHLYVALLEQCSTMSQLKQIHAHALRTGHFSNPSVAGRILAFCALQEPGSLPYARLVFNQIPNPTNFISNTIIRAHTNNNLHRQAIALYRELIETGLSPDNFTFPSLFKSSGSLREGRQLHCHCIKFGFSSDSYIQNTMMNMYSNCGSLDSARAVFDKMADKTVVSWATMIGACARWDCTDEAFELFRAMEFGNVKPNGVTLVNVLTACARARNLEMAKWVHEYIDGNGIRCDVVLATALMDAYTKCGCFSRARDLFNKMPEKNLFCWNIAVNGHLEESDFEEALLLFREMQVKGVRPDEVTMVSLVQACTHLGALGIGKWLHAYIEAKSIVVDVVLGTALVDMYAKCGSVEMALQVFDGMPKKDIMTWTAMIAGLAMSGQGEAALDLFGEMQKNGFKPDAVTLVGVLAACSHSGLVDEGRSYFNSMSTAYGVRPSVEHYGCMVDMLGRAGHIAEAEELIRDMPMKPDYFVLGGLLGACRIHGNLEAAERTTQKLLELNPHHGGTYVLLSNIYSSLGKRDEAKRTRELMKERNVNKPPGCSLIEMDGIVHEFVKGDTSHARSSEIYEMLEEIVRRLKEGGHVPNISDVLLDMDEEEKENALSLHSEKLAISFGLISTSPGTPIRVVKNLRVCRDCHSAAKLISKIYDRRIILRDRIRFHHFEDGVCTCNDFW